MLTSFQPLIFLYNLYFWDLTNLAVSKIPQHFFKSKRTVNSNPSKGKIKFFRKRKSGENHSSSRKSRRNTWKTSRLLTLCQLEKTSKTSKYHWLVSFSNLICNIFLFLSLHLQVLLTWVEKKQFFKETVFETTIFFSSNWKQGC